MNNIYRNKLTYILIFIMMSLIFINAQQSPVHELAYSGFVTQKNGDAVNGTIAMQFALYDVSNDGVDIWHEFHDKVTVTDGEFSVMLGSIDPNYNPLTPEMFEKQLWLGIRLFGTAPAEYQYYDYANEYESVYNTETRGEMTPRIKLSMSPYAFHALSAEQAVNADRALTADHIEWKGLIDVPPGVAEAIKMQDGDVVKWNTATDTANNADQAANEALDKATAVEGWGNHNKVGYLTKEEDRLYVDSEAAKMQVGDVAKWNATKKTADDALNKANDVESWGDHRAAGYLKQSDINQLVSRIDQLEDFVTTLTTSKIEVTCQGNAVNSSTLAFKTYGVNGKDEKTITIYNRGVNDLGIYQISSNNSKFAITNTITKIPSFTSKTFKIIYSSSTSGVDQGQIMITNNSVAQPVFMFNVTGTCLKEIKGTKEYSTDGVFTVPDLENVSLSIKAYGAGGGGGGSYWYLGPPKRNCGEGGTAGDFVEKVIATEKNTSYRIVVGAGGQGGKSGKVSTGPPPEGSQKDAEAGQPGGDSIVYSSSGTQLFISTGGIGGRGATTATNYDYIGEYQIKGQGGNGHNPPEPGAPSYDRGDTGAGGAVIVTWTGYQYP